MIHALFDSLITQDKIELKKSIYLNEELSNAALDACVNVTCFHFRESTNYHQIEETERWDSDNFFLSHLSVENEEEIVPIIWTVENESPKIVGIVMPFDDLSVILNKSDSNAIGKLSAKWITLQVINKRKTGA